MAWRSIGFGSVALAAVAMAGYSIAGSAAADGPGAIDQARLEAADSDADNWLGYGRTYDEAALLSARTDQRRQCR